MIVVVLEFLEISIVKESSQNLLKTNNNVSHQHAKKNLFDNRGKLRILSGLDRDFCFLYNSLTPMRMKKKNIQTRERRLYRKRKN